MISRESDNAVAIPITVVNPDTKQFSVSVGAIEGIIPGTDYTQEYTLEALAVQ